MNGAASIDPSRVRRLTPRVRDEVESAERDVLAIMVSSPRQRFFSFAGVLSSHSPLSMILSALLRKRHRCPQIPSREWWVQ
jgi:hypothetical protein